MSYKQKWWKKFYTSLWQNTQPSAHSLEETQKEVDFIEKSLHLKSNTKILDIPCGDGRISLELASRGYQLDGVDFNIKFLQRAQQNAIKNNLKINWHKKDMRNINWKNQFDAALCWWTSFGYFNNEENENFLHSISKALKINGYFILDTQTVETLYPRFQKNGFSHINNVKMLIERSIDIPNGRLEENFTFIKNNKKTHHHSSIRLYTYKEIIGLLKKCGFNKFKAYGSLHNDKFDLGSSRLLLISQKQNE